MVRERLLVIVGSSWCLFPVGVLTGAQEGLEGTQIGIILHLLYWNVYREDHNKSVRWSNMDCQTFLWHYICNIYHLVLTRNPPGYPPKTNHWYWKYVWENNSFSRERGFKFYTFTISQSFGVHFPPGQHWSKYLEGWHTWVCLFSSQALILYRTIAPYGVNLL